MNETFKPFKLTRFLYNEEEVKLSLITSILNKKNIFECYYWFSELYFSKLDVCDIIWEIYFDYYALINPKLENYINKKINDWKEKGKFECLLYIIKNLHISKHDCRVFLLRQVSISDNLCQVYIYPSCKSNHIKKYDKKYHSLLISLKRSKWIDICYYLNKVFKNKDNSHYEIYNTISCYLLKDEPSLYKIYNDLWNRRTDKRDFHFTLKMICSLMLKINCINDKSIYVSPLREDIDEIKSLEQPVNPIYKTLPNRRWFKIDENIGSFNLTRFGFIDYKAENYNWEYYASFSPLWKERIEEFRATINHVKKTIEFDDDESLEGFYEKYGYELDEQNKEVQNCSMLNIIKKSWVEWFISIGYEFLGYGYVNKKAFQIDNDVIKTNLEIDIYVDDMPLDFKFQV